MERESRQTWAKRVRRWKRSGLRAHEFAEREGIKTKTLWWWGWRLARETSAEQTRPAFVEVVTTENAGDSAPSTRLRALEVVVRESARVMVPVDFDENHLRRLLRVVEGG